MAYLFKGGVVNGKSGKRFPWKREIGFFWGGCLSNRDGGNAGNWKKKGMENSRRIISEDPCVREREKKEK